MNGLKIISCAVLAALSLTISDISLAEQSTGVELIQWLKDDINGVDGLGNPRNVSIVADNSKVFITSGDDNAFAVFNADENFHLSFSQVFKNASADVSGLEGASGVVLLDNGKKVVATGYYDGALALFSRQKDVYTLSQVLTDGLSYDRVFDSEDPVDGLDKLGLLGAWEITKTADEKQLIVASYMSDTVSIITLDAADALVAQQKLTAAQPFSTSLGKPIGVALSPSNEELYVLGFEANKVTIFDRKADGSFIAKQELVDGVSGVQDLKNPQKVVASPNGKYLYVASAGSQAIVVFHRLPSGEFAQLQVVNNQDIGGSGLEGASSLAMTADGLQLFAAGEAGRGFYQFSVNTNGRITLVNQQLGDDAKPLKGISSLTLTDDNRFLLVATGKSNALAVYRLQPR